MNSTGFIAESADLAQPMQTQRTNPQFTAIRQEQDREILPKTIKPTHYRLELTPNAQDFTFKGLIDIDVNVLQSTDLVQLNSRELSVHSCVVKLADGTVIQPVHIEANEKTQVLSLKFNQSLPLGNAMLSIQYTGIINDQMSGFYRSQYTEESTGLVKYLFSTHFEPTHARRAFPCWDEPEIKAKFKLAINCSKDLVALSNMNEFMSTECPDTGMVKHEFAETPIMSTYLIGFAVGDLGFLERIADTQPPVKVRVYARKDKVKQCGFSLDIACKVLKIFNEYYDIPYPLPKLDLLAVPDFPIGAMENWGMTTYREILLYADESTTSFSMLQRSAITIAHEIAHQWFGNLVTMEWWSDLWLKEGFATWMGYFAVDKIFPKWDLWTKFLIEETEEGLTLDGQRSSHPIEVPVRSPGEIGQIFDSISYAKGGAILNMLASFLGDETFRDGIRVYLKENSYGNAKTVDLWNALGQVSGKPVMEIMHNWTSKVGFPVLFIKDSGDLLSLKENDKNQITLKVKQERFLNSGGLKPDEDLTTWMVPITVMTKQTGQESTVTSHLLSNKESSLTIPQNIFYKLNSQQFGFYRVKYPDSYTPKLYEAIQSGMIESVRDRLSIVSDASVFAFLSAASTIYFLSLLSAYAKHLDYVVWAKISEGLGQIMSSWFEENQENVDLLKSFIKNLFEPIIKVLGFEENEKESQDVKLLRAVAVSRAGSAGSQFVVKEALKKFNDFIENDKPLTANLRHTILSLAVSNDFPDNRNYFFVRQLYFESTAIDEKLDALSALGYTKDSKLLNLTLKMTIDEQGTVRSQDIMSVIRPISSNRIGRRLTLAFVTENWSTIYSRYHLSAPIILQRIVTSTFSNFSDSTDLENIKAFFEGRDVSACKMAVDQAIEKVTMMAAWRSGSRSNIIQWLKDNQ